MRLILASASPRRADLLGAAGFAFDVRPVEVDETPREGEAPSDYVIRLALEKARACPAGSDDVVVAADTTVVAGGRILAKPEDRDDARAMLRTLSGRQHEVLTGVALRRGEQLTSRAESTLVRFLTLTPDEIEWYLDSGEPYDKAGAYALQGLASRFVERVEGSAANVIGLPVARLYLMLNDLLGRAAVRALGVPALPLPPPVD